MHTLQGLCPRNMFPSVCRPYHLNYNTVKTKITLYSTVIILAMSYTYALQAMNYAAKLGLNDGRFAFIMFDLDLDLSGNTKKNISLTWEKGSENRTLAFQSALLISVNNNVSTEYLAFMEDMKKKSASSPFYSPVHPGSTVSI